MTRVFCAALATETNTFSPIATQRHHFDEWFHYPAGTHPRDAPTLFTAPLWVARQRAEALGWSVSEGLCAAAFPSGPVVRADYLALRDQLLADLRSVGPADIVLLGLHGAMVADGYPDCEGDILRHVRDIVGPQAIVAAELDPHCHLTESMLEAADLLICFKEYPHSDSLQRAEELVELAHQAHCGRIKPVMRMADTGMIAQFFTGSEPARGLVAHMRELERRDGVLSVSLVHGFASGDVEDMGTRSLVITDNNADLAQSLAGQLAERAWNIRTSAAAKRTSMDAAVALVRKLGDGKAPLVLADCADNPGGGAPGDSTYMLRALLDAGESNIAVAALWDPLAVAMAEARGEGARLQLRIGGKATALSGLPLDLEVRVERIVHHASQSFGGGEVPMGTLVTVSAGATEVLLCTLRNQCLTPQLLADGGVDISTKKVVIVKSNHHFYDGFAPLAGDIIYLDTPGVAVNDPATAAVSYKNLRRPLWPLRNDSRP